MSAYVIAIVGAAGSGKTWLGDRLSARLLCPRLAIDDFGSPGTDRWPLLIDAIQGIDGRVVVESCSTPPLYRHLISYSVLLQIPDQVRLTNLKQRGESRSEAERLIRDSSRIASKGDLVLTRIDESTVSQVEHVLRSVTDGHLVGDSHCNGDGHQGVEPFSPQTDTGSQAAPSMYGFQASAGDR